MRLTFFVSVYPLRRWQRLPAWVWRPSRALPQKSDSSLLNGPFVASKLKCCGELARGVLPAFFVWYFHGQLTTPTKLRIARCTLNHRFYPYCSIPHILTRHWELKVFNGGQQTEMNDRLHKTWVKLRIIISAICFLILLERITFILGMRISSIRKRLIISSHISFSDYLKTLLKFRKWKIIEK